MENPEVKITRLENQPMNSSGPQARLGAQFPEQLEQVRIQSIATGLLQKMAQQASEIFLLEWEGYKIPSGAVINGKSIGWTQHGMVRSTEGEDIGTYERTVEFGGASGKEQKMLVFPFPTNVPEEVLEVREKFGPAVSECEFTIPVDYDHPSQIDTFRKHVKKLKTLNYLDERLTSKNFAKASVKIEPGKTYKVKIFPILSEVSCEDCISFLVKQNAILVGAQGMTLLQVQMPMVFPVKKRTLSFDEKDALHVATGGYHYLPYVYRYPPSWKYEGRLVSPYPPLRDHGCDFTFISFELNDPDTDYCLLCFSGV